MRVLLKGDVSWKANTAADATIFASGDIYGNGHSLTGYNGAGTSIPLSLTSMGTIAMTSGGSYDTVTANCDVWLSGGAAANNANAVRNLCTAGGSKVSGTATANNRITAAGSGWGNGTFQARAAGVSLGPVCQPSGTPADVSRNIASTCAAEAVNGISLSGGTTFSAAKSLADIKISNATVISTEAVGNIDRNGAVSRGGGAPNIPAVPLVVETDDPAFNAWQYSGSANYLFYFASGVAKVKVRNVNGVTDGVYNVASLPALPANLLTANAVSGTWTIRQANVSNATFVSGVVWFDGDLYIEQGTYYNTFIATRNIRTGGGDHRIYPPNFATQNGSIDPTTPNSPPWGTPAFAYVGLCNRPNSPKNYCSGVGAPVANYNLQASGVGSYALMAGSFNGGSIDAGGNVVNGRFTYGVSNDYVGGNVYTSITIPIPSPPGGNASGAAWVWGYILAGNGADTAGGTTNVGGSSYIYGRINSQGYGTASPGQVQTFMGLGGTTVIDLTKVPASVSSTLLGDGSVGSLGRLAPGIAPINNAPVLALAIGNAGRGGMGTAKSVSVVAGVPSAPQFHSAASIQANAVPSNASISGPVTVSLVSATFK